MAPCSLLAIIVATAVAMCTGADAANATFYPTMNMTDTDCNLIQAHGGAILQGQSGNDSSWYWFGEDKTGETTSGHFIGVNCYTSSDFSTWDYVGSVLSPISGTNISNSSIVERPKRQLKLRRRDGRRRHQQAIAGQYTWRGSFKPFGNDSRDMTVWKDPSDASAYLIFATTGNVDLGIASLDDDYYNVSEGLYTFQDIYWEAPGVFKIDEVYYLLYSPQDSWTPTNNAYMTASSMSGPWSEPTLLAPAGAYTYLTQNAYDITINGTNSTTYVYYGDHWSGTELSSSTYSFYPVIYNGTGLSLHRTGGWALDAAAGTWSDLPYSVITAADSTTPNATLVACDDSCAGGIAVNMTANQTFGFTWVGSSGDKVLGIQYVYAGPKNAFKHIAVTVNGTVAAGNALLETTIGTNVSQESPFPVTLISGSSVSLTLLDYDGDEFLVDSVKVYDLAESSDPRDSKG